MASISKDASSIRQSEPELFTEGSTRIPVRLFAIGLDAYWDQFEGLQQKLLGFAGKVAERLRRPGVDVVNLGLIDSPEKALAAGHAFRRADVDLLFLHVTTYALSSTVLPVVRRAKVPVIVLNLSPGAAIDYTSFNARTDRGSMTGEWLAWCQACPVPEISNVFRRCNIPFFQITGMLDHDPPAWSEIDEWLDAARVAHVMEHNRLGVMGHFYGGMLDVYSDLTCATFGGHIEIVEVDELAALREQVSRVEIENRIAHFREEFDVQADCSLEELERAAKTSLALDQLVRQHALGSIAYYCSGTGANEDAISSIILGTSLLTARGIPESVPGPILEIGNTNSRYRFVIGARRFINEWNSQGPAHHCAVGVGHIASKIEKLGQLLGSKPSGSASNAAWATMSSYLLDTALASILFRRQ